MDQSRFGSHSRLQAVLLAIFAVALSAWSIWMFGQRSVWLPDLASEHGADFDSEFTLTLAITGFMFVATQLALGYLVLRFSRQNGKPETPSKGFEKRFAIIAAIVVFSVDVALFTTAEASLRRVGDMSMENATVVEVTAEQFAWNFRYPGPDQEFGRTETALINLASNPLGLDPNDPASADDIIRINQMHVPIDSPVQVMLRSKDVIHSFALPNHRVKQDAVPGMLIEARFQPTETGTFEVVCNQICGLGHYRMRAFLTVESRAEFETWLADEEAGF